MQPAEQETGNRESDIPERHFIGAHMPCPWSSRPTSFNAPPPPSRWKSGAFTVFPSPTVGSRRVPLFIQIKSASETLLEPDATPLLPSTPLLVQISTAQPNFHSLHETDEDGEEDEPT